MKKISFILAFIVVAGSLIWHSSCAKVNGDYCSIYHYDSIEVNLYPPKDTTKIDTIAKGEFRANLDSLIKLQSGNATNAGQLEHLIFGKMQLTLLDADTLLSFNNLDTITAYVKVLGSVEYKSFKAYRDSVRATRVLAQYQFERSTDKFTSDSTGGLITYPYYITARMKHRFTDTMHCKFYFYLVAKAGSSTTTYF